ncbi:MAG: hypothetical protein ACREJQ_08485, partial [bacterium]
MAKVLLKGLVVSALFVFLMTLLASCQGEGGEPPATRVPGAGDGTGQLPGDSDFGQAAISPAQASGWSTETVDSAANVGWQTSIEVGVPASAPLVHISYYEQIQKDLKLASGSQGGPWVLSTLDAPFDVGRYNSMAGGAVSYYQASGKLKAWRPAGPGPEVVDPQLDLGAFNDIVTGGGGELHVSYVGTYIITNLNRRSQLRHAVFNGATWATEVVDDAAASAGSFQFSSIAEDSGGVYHISYRGQTGQLNHAFGNTGVWTTGNVLPGNSMTSQVGQTSIVTAFDGTIHIFYSKVGAGAGLYHAWNPPAGWNVELVALGFGIMTPSAALQDQMGILHVAAYKSNTQDLVLFSSGSWTSETLDSAGDVGKFAAIAVDSENCLHISYVEDGVADNLKYATNWNSGGCTTSAVEVDVFPDSLAEVHVVSPFGEETIVARGPTTVEVQIPPSGAADDSDNDDLDEVATEIVQMELTGHSGLLNTPVNVRVRSSANHPNLKTLGEIEESVNNTPGTLDIPPFRPVGS